MRVQKTLFAFVFLLIAQSLSVHGQWQPPGGSGSIYYNGGNVGIGTTTPTAPFNVSTSAQVMSVFQNPNASNSWISVMNNTGQMNLGVGAFTPHPYICYR